MAGSWVLACGHAGGDLVDKGQELEGGHLRHGSGLGEWRMSLSRCRGLQGRVARAGKAPQRGAGDS